MANTIARGFYDYRHLLSTPIANVEPRIIETGITNSVAYHNQQTNSALRLWTITTTEATRRYRTRTGTRNQGLDEVGRAIPSRVAIAEYDTGLPFYRSGNAWGADWESRLKMPLKDVNDTLVEFLVGDRVYLRDQIYAAFLNNTDLSFVDPQYGTITVKPLANGDSVTYARRGSGVLATDTHYKAQAAGILDASNPYPDIRADLVEHPENGDTVIHVIASNLVEDTKALSTFYDAGDPNIEPASSAARLIGRLPAGVVLPGDIIGYVSDGTKGSWIVEGPEVPAGYIISFTLEGEPPIAMRQDPLPQLQGFIRAAEIETFPWYKQEFRRHCGFGAWNRVGAVVTLIGAGAYAVPSGWTRPIP